MGDVNVVNKQVRVRCGDEAFLEAVFSSKTYAEISEKTGQKIATTMARYARVKSALAKKGLDLPTMERAKPVKTVDNLEVMAEAVRRLQAVRSGQ